MKHWEIKDTPRGIPVTTHANERSSGDKATHVVIANGFVGGTLANELALRLFDASQGTIDVSTYQEPYVGVSGYAESYRAEMFNKVVRKIGGRVLVLAHSRGMMAWAHTEPELLKDEVVQGLAGLTPIGVSNLSQETAPHLVARLGAEIAHAPFTTFDSAIMTLKVAGHILQRCRRPGAILEEVIQTLRSDTSASVINTSRIIPTTMILGSYDRLVPPVEVADRLNTGEGYRGDLVEIPTTHAGAFTDYRHVPAIYGAIEELNSK